MNAIDLAYRGRRLILRLFRWRTRGVKAMVFDRAGRMLLIRNRYGRTDLFVLPGGGIKRREEPAAAAIREVREEVSCGLVDLSLVGLYRSADEGKRDTIHVFRGITDDEPVADLTEVAEARFFALDRLPPTVSPATLRRIDDLASGGRNGDRW